MDTQQELRIITADAVTRLRAWALQVEPGPICVLDLVDAIRAWAARVESVKLPNDVIVAEARDLADVAEVAAAWALHHDEAAQLVRDRLLEETAALAAAHTKDTKQ